MKGDGNRPGVTWGRDRTGRRMGPTGSLASTEMNRDWAYGIRSEIHYGGLALQVAGICHIDGHLATAGELTLSDQRPRHADDLTSVQALYSA
jgi:hypothetical protein